MYIYIYINNITTKMTIMSTRECRTPFVWYHLQVELLLSWGFSYQSAAALFVLGWCEIIDLKGLPHGCSPCSKFLGARCFEVMIPSYCAHSPQHVQLKYPWMDPLGRYMILLSLLHGKLFTVSFHFLILFWLSPCSVAPKDFSTQAMLPIGPLLRVPLVERCTNLNPHQKEW